MAARHQCAECMDSALVITEAAAGEVFMFPYCRCPAGIIEKSNKKHWHCSLPGCNQLSVSNRQERIDRHIKKHPGFVVSDYGLSARHRAPAERHASAVPTTKHAARPAGATSQAQQPLQDPVWLTQTPLLPQSPESPGSLGYDTMSDSSGGAGLEDFMAVDAFASYFDQLLLPTADTFTDPFTYTSVFPTSGAFPPPTPDGQACLDLLPSFEDISGIAESQLNAMWMDLSEAPQPQQHQSNPSACATGSSSTACPVSVLVPMLDNASLRPATLGDMTEASAPHFAISPNVKSFVKDFGAKAGRLSCHVISINVAAGYIIRECSVRAIVATANEVKRPQLMHYAPGKEPQGCRGEGQVLVHLLQPKNPNVASVMLAATLVLEHEGSFLEECSQQVYFLRESAPSRSEVLHHLLFLLQTSYREDYRAQPKVWNEAIKEMTRSLSLSQFLQVLQTELKPRGWNAIKAELKGKDFSLTPQEASLGLRHLVAKTLTQEEAAADAAAWEEICKELSDIKASVSFPEFFKGREGGSGDGKLRGLKRIKSSTKECLSIVVS